MALRTEDIVGLNFSGVAIDQPIGPVTPGRGVAGGVHAAARLVGVRWRGNWECRGTASPGLWPARAVTAETATLLGERFGTSAEFWLNLQMAHDLEQARRQRRAA